eukprot:Skav236682  [mRNA]  locus=scaffold406:151890:154444:- [translate_table: standard]
MSNFLNACQNCRIDAIAIHSYWCTLDAGRRYGWCPMVANCLAAFFGCVGTEAFACADQNFDVSMGGQIRFMKEVVPWLEQEDIIEKYAWFSIWDTYVIARGHTQNRGYFTNEWQYGITNPNPDAGLVHPNGDLSELGRVYVNLASSRRLSDGPALNSTEPIFA